MQLNRDVALLLRDALAQPVHRTAVALRRVVIEHDGLNSSMAQVALQQVCDLLVVGPLVHAADGRGSFVADPAVAHADGYLLEILNLLTLDGFSRSVSGYKF